MRLFRRVFQRIVQSRLRAMRPNQRDWIVSELVRWARSQRSQYYPRPLLADEFLEMGRELGVRSFSIKGKLGTFEGLFADRVIAREFLIALDWAGSINAMLTDGIFREGRGTLLDIGANVGLTSIPVSAQRRIRSIAFEPEPTNFRYLRKNILENDVEDLVRPINIALFSKDDQLLDFELSESNLGDHHVSVPTQSDSQEVGEGRSGSKIKVRASRLDSVIDESELERPLAVKIDTQGCEVEVVRGGQRLLKSADWLVTEFSPQLLSRFGERPETLIESLAGLDFCSGAVMFDENRPRDSSKSPIPSLEPAAAVFERLASFARTATDDQQIDVLLSRKSLEP